MFITETDERRKNVIRKLGMAEECMVVMVMPREANGRQPIGMHLAQLDKLGSALLALIQHDQGFYETMGEMVNEVRHRPIGQPLR